MSQTTNPLLRDYGRIPFDEIDASHVVPGVPRILEEARSEIDALVSNEAEPTYDNTLQRLDDVLERVRRRIAPVRHLLSVAETPELREGFNEVLPEITEFWTRITLNAALWQRLKNFAETDEAVGLEGIHERHLRNLLRDFRRAGADLAPAHKEKLSVIRLELSRLQLKFSENVLDATNAYSLLITDGARLDGVPRLDRDQARDKAKAEGVDGWLLTLDYPSFEPIVKYAVDRELRRELQTAYVDRCRCGEFSNVDIIQKLLELRRRLAVLLGYADFADYRLEDHMAQNGTRAFDFVVELTARTRPHWKRDLLELSEHAATLGISEFEPWDVAFVSEHLRRARFNIDDEVTRPYFPLQRVLEGLFEVARRTFGLIVTEQEIKETWHEDVRFYDLLDEADGTHLGSFYVDWHPRPEKRQGAWMNDLKTGGPSENGFDSHLGIIAGNLTPPKGGTPSLLTHSEVETVFHEFGHLLHHLTSRVPIAPMAGINVAWDFVEVPSQLMENWTWEEEALPLFSGHYETGDPLPQEIYERLQRARRFMGGWKQMRQLSFAYVDLRLHRDDPEEASGNLMARVEGLLDTYTPNTTFARAHATPSFTHLFSGGYAAAYYSYLWSQVLEADAFGRFREEGIFAPSVGKAFMEAILTRGDSDAPEQLFREFMGRDPDQQALLDRNLGPDLSGLPAEVLMSDKRDNSGLDAALGSG